eukprot:5436303-Pleurochrysis_carterae.AAC.1
MGASGPLRPTSSQEELIPYHTIRAVCAAQPCLPRRSSPARAMLASPCRRQPIKHYPIAEWIG